MLINYRNCIQIAHILSILQVKCPSDYSKWLESMYSLFGTKWCKLHRGPGWSVEAVEQGAKPSTEGLSPLIVRFGT